MSGNSKRQFILVLKPVSKNRKMIATLLYKKILILEFTISLMDVLALVYINVISLVLVE
jgi:hypothetical protein